MTNPTTNPRQPEMYDRVRVYHNGELVDDGTVYLAPTSSADGRAGVYHVWFDCFGEDDGGDPAICDEADGYTITLLGA